MTLFTPGNIFKSTTEVFEAYLPFRKILLDNKDPLDNKVIDNWQQKRRQSPIADIELLSSYLFHFLERPLARKVIIQYANLIGPYATIV